LPNTKQSHFLLALIEVSNGCLKLRVRQPNAAVRHVREAEQHMAAARGLEIAFDIDAFLQRCTLFRTEILTGDVGAALSSRPSLDATQTALDA
jgi:hypothetical protein